MNEKEELEELVRKREELEELKKVRDLIYNTFSEEEKKEVDRTLANPKKLNEIKKRVIMEWMHEQIEEAVKNPNFDFSYIAKMGLDPYEFKKMVDTLNQNLKELLVH